MKTLSVLNKTKQTKMIYSTYKNTYYCCYSKSSCSHSYNDVGKLYNEISQYIEYIDSDLNVNQDVINNQEYQARKRHYISKLEQIKNSIMKKFRDKKGAYILPLLMKSHSRYFRYLKDNDIKYNMPKNGMDLMMLIIAIYEM